MAEPTTNIISEEELKEKLVSIYNDLKAGMTYKEAKNKYGIGKEVVSDFRYMTEKEFEYFLDKISDIKGDIQEGKKISKIASEFGCGRFIVGFVKKQICEESDIKKDKIQKDSRENYKRTEKMWKEYRSGVSLEDISFLYNHGQIEDTKNILNSFQRLLSNERGIALQGDKKQRKSLISSKYGFDDDTIDYILYGNKQAEIITVEECKEKLTKLYEDITIKSQPSYYLQDNYQVTPYIVSELRRMPKEKFDKFLEEIPHIERRVKQGLQDQNITSKIGMEIGIAGKLVTYVANNISKEYANRKSKIKTDTSKKLGEEEGVSINEP